MIIQTTVTRDECFLIKKLLPIWQKYADGFVFMIDARTTDDTREYLQANKEKYNILEILVHDWETADPHETEAYGRQRMFNAAYKYSNKIICLDTDEYLDGTLSKQQLEAYLDTEKNTVFLLQWIQYTSKNKIRVDDAWVSNFKDRIGSYTYNSLFDKRPNHSFHMPFLQATPSDAAILVKSIDPTSLFIAHITWIDKRSVGIKQYYWKVWDYVQHKLYNVNIIDCKDYDSSVNNFVWKTATFEYPLKIDDDVYSNQNIKNNTKLKYIVEQTQKHNIPDLGDWGMGIYEYATSLSQTTNKHVDVNTTKEISVLIVTFKERFLHVKDLIQKLRGTSGDSFDILLAVNGNNEELVEEKYREDILELCKNTPRCYPIICPEFKSLPKLWNTLVLFSRTEYNFIICDDVDYGNLQALDIIKKYITNTNEQFFTINGEFSFFVITKNILHRLNYFDERMCGYGEEDGDITHSFILCEKRSLPMLQINNIRNKALYDIKNEHIETHVDNKPKFNREFANLKYFENSSGICGMNPTPISRCIEDKQQYPYEMFVKHNKHNIKKYNNVIMKYEE